MHNVYLVNLTVHINFGCRASHQQGSTLTIYPSTRPLLQLYVGLSHNIFLICMSFLRFKKFSSKYSATFSIFDKIGIFVSFTIWGKRGQTRIWLLIARIDVYWIVRGVLRIIFYLINAPTIFAFYLGRQGNNDFLVFWRADYNLSTQRLRYRSSLRKSKKYVINQEKKQVSKPYFFLI